MPPMGPEGGIPPQIVPPEAMAGMMETPGAMPGAGAGAGLAPGPVPNVAPAAMGPMGPPKTVPAPNDQQMDAFIRAIQQTQGGNLPQ